MQLALPAFHVPKTRPSRAKRIAAFKKQAGIWTYLSDLPKEEQPWNAMLIDVARGKLAGYSDDRRDVATCSPFDLIAGFCRLLDESNLLVTGETERKAIETLLRKNDSDELRSTVRLTLFYQAFA